MEKKANLICAAASLVLSALALVLVLWLILRGIGQPAAAEPAPTPAPATEQDANAAYRLEKLNNVNDMILSREIVPQDYLRYLEEGLAGMVEEYNSLTARLKSCYLSHMSNTAWSLAYNYDGVSAPEAYSSRPSYYYLADPDHPNRYYTFIDRASTLALFPNYSDLAQTDPATAYLAWAESGSSSGLWATSLLHTSLADEETRTMTEEYFHNIDAILDRIDAVRAAYGA